MHYLRNQKNLEELQNQDKERFLDKKLGFSTINNCIIVPHIGCFDPNKCFVDGTWLHETTTFPFNKSYNENTIHIKKAVYIGCLASIWGHCITDGIKRLWFLFSEYLESLQDVVFLYTTVNSVPLPENYKKILKYIIPENIKLEEIQQNAIVDELYIPDVSFYSSPEGEKFYYKEFTFILNLLKEQYIKPENFPPFEKIYLSRTALKSHREYGEKKIEELFLKVGFTIIHPECYTLEQQLYLYENCKYLASLEGSGAHNSLFCKPETKVYIIRKSDFINPYQITIDKISGVEEIYIDSNFSVFNSRTKPWAGPFFVYINKYLAQCVNKEFSQRIKSHFSVLLFIGYSFSSMLGKCKSLLRVVYHKLLKK